MPLQFSAAHSSRINKTKPKNPLLQRSSSSPFLAFNRRKPIQRSQSKPETIDSDDDLFGDRLDDKGFVTSLATDLNLRDVAQIIRYIRTHMFDQVPEKGGLNSTRIAKVLNFRTSLPPMITTAHVHAMIQSPTTTEREITELTKAGTIRKLVIPGRGTGGSSISEALVLVTEWENVIRESKGLDEELVVKFLQCLQDRPLALTLPRSNFTAPEAMALMSAGFLTSSSQSMNSANIYAKPNASISGTMTSLASISKAASGSMAAVGGQGAIHQAGGSGKGIGLRRSSSQLEPEPQKEASRVLPSTGEFQLALPGTGPYLWLLTAARSHLVSLLGKSKYKEIPVDLLRERWDGGVAADDATSGARKSRGEFSGTLPGRTRKWKQFFGLGFDWVLAECLGAGLVEVFETGSVGRGVRVV